MLQCGLDNLNTINAATEKFRILLDNVNIQINEKIKSLIGRVRSVLVHEAKLEEYTDYVLLSELNREIILRLINSKVKRYSRFEEPIIQGESPHLTYRDYITNKNLEVKNVEIFSEEENAKMLSLVQQ